MFKITKKDLQYNYNYIVRGGYCEYQTILRGAKELGYARGVYGWNWTAYSIYDKDGNEVIICTGYRDMTGKRLNGLEKYEKKAKEINNNYNLTWQERDKKLKKLQKDFANYIVANYEGA